MRELRGHLHPVLSLAFAPDGRTLASGDQEGSVRLWDLASGTGVDLLDLPRTKTRPGREWMDDADPRDRFLDTEVPVLSLAYAPAHSLLAVGLTQGVLVYDFDSWMRSHFARRLGGSCVVAFGRTPTVSGDLLAFTGYLEREIDVIDLEIPVIPLQQLTGFRGILALASPPTLPLLASAGGLPGLPELLLWDLELGGPPIPLVGHDLPVYAVAFSPSGRHLVSGSRDGSVRLWDLCVPNALSGSSETLFADTGTVVSVAFRPDGRSVLAAYDTGRIVCWTLARARARGPTTGELVACAASLSLRTA